MIKRAVQCAVVLVAVNLILDIAILDSLSKLEHSLDCITHEMSDIELEVDKIEDDIFTITEEPVHTRAYEVMGDTEEQIQEEIRLGEMELLAQLVHAEAGNQDLEGKRLVADVVLNRVEHDWADGTIEGVIFQTLSNGVAQFSTTQDGSFDRAGWEMTESDFLAAKMEYEATYRLDDKIMYFRAGKWPDYGTHAYRYGGHYFCYE